MTKTYKYKTELDQICLSGTDCPPASAQEYTGIAFRWVTDPISAQCFLPQAKRNPARLHRESDPEKICSCWGLSLHKTSAASIRSFQALEKNFPNIRKIFGGNLARGTILPKHGVCTTPDQHGHFDLHEYEAGAVSDAFTIIQRIP